MWLQWCAFMVKAEMRNCGNSHPLRDLIFLVKFCDIPWKNVLLKDWKGKLLNKNQMILLWVVKWFSDRTKKPRWNSSRIPQCNSIRELRQHSWGAFHFSLSRDSLIGEDQCSLKLAQSHHYVPHGDRTGSRGQTELPVISGGLFPKPWVNHPLAPPWCHFLWPRPARGSVTY